MRICFLMYHGSMYSGGQGIYLYYLTQELTRLGHEVHVIAGPPYPEMPEGVTMHPVEGYSWFQFVENRRAFLSRPNLLQWFYPLNFLEFGTTRAGIFSLMITFSLRALAKLKELQPRHHFDVVHDNQCLGIGVYLMKTMGVPVVATIHHPLSVDVKNAVAQARGPIEKARRLIYYPILMQELVARRLDRIITVSQASKAMVQNAFDIPPEKMHVVYNGVDTDTFRPLGIDKEPNRIIYVGNSEDRNKGARYLIKALSMLPNDMDWRLSWVDRPREQLYMAPRLVRRYGLNTFIDFTGRLPTPELVRRYNRAQFMVCPSLYEGFGLPPAEAMSCGLPVVSTNAGALPEVIKNGETGILVPPRNAKALAQGIMQLWEDPRLRQRMGKAARQHVVERFSWRRAALETLEVYHEACSQQKKTSSTSLENALSVPTAT